MSKVAETYFDIELMLEQGLHPLRISQLLEVPVTFVYDVVESIEQYGPAED